MIEDPAEVLSGSLWIGSVKGASNRDWMRSHNVQFILNATAEIPNFFEGDDQLSYCRLGLADDPKENLLCHLDTICNFIDKARERKTAVLVHCQAGISRSASVVLMYLMKCRKMTLKQAYSITSTVRPNIGPNSGYFIQLSNLEQSLIGKTTFSAKDYFTDQLLAMGFPKDRVLRALAESGNRLDIAITLLLTHAT